MAERRGEAAGSHIVKSLIVSLLRVYLFIYYVFIFKAILKVRHVGEGADLVEKTLVSSVLIVLRMKPLQGAG